MPIYESKNRAHNETFFNRLNFIYHLSLWPLGTTKWIIGLKSEKLKVQFKTSPINTIVKNCHIF
jgi:hypothetical protein